ncbi:hypothetical protein SGRI78S_06611 [Streptomyces griseus subsp. griseus]
MINRELSKRLAAGRDRRLTQLADAATRWGGHVPEDPGITELADLLETAAADVPAPPGDPGHTARPGAPGTPPGLSWPVRSKTSGPPPGSEDTSPRSPSGTSNAP